MKKLNTKNLGFRLKAIIVLCSIYMYTSTSNIFGQDSQQEKPNYQSVPQGFNYQGIARDASGKELINRNIEVRFTIHSELSDGNIVYQETHNTITNEKGLITLVIGKGKPVKGLFSDIKWASANFFMNVEMNDGRGAGFVNMGTTQLLSVPYALVAGTIVGGESNYNGKSNPPVPLIPPGFCDNINDCIAAGAVTGITGPTGPTGPTGANGATGPTGAAGTNGTNGVTGPMGATGTNGTNGATGPTGVAGTNGTNGVTGPTGAAGTNGTNGATGATGDTGPTGPAGANGATGATGANGTNGATGTTGVAGTNGTNGATGTTGAAGTNGTNGVTGTTGATGPTGSFILNYQIYSALLTQSGTNPPVVTVLENTIGNIVWTRVQLSGAVEYVGTLAGAFPANKTWYPSAINGAGPFPNTHTLGTFIRTSNNDMTIRGLIDGGLNFTTIEIRVYP
ncbi:MAG: collagen-like protein [Bacteroidetes bacterium]|nr:collagen-like protein [Bacteroidota bacterium]